MGVYGRKAAQKILDQFGITVSISGGTAKRVSPREFQTHSQPRWSPGGKHILYISEKSYKRTLMVVPHKGGVATEVATDVDDFAWSPNTR